MRGGLLRNRIDILAPTKVKDGSGYITTWDPIANGSDVAASVTFMGGREALLDQTLKSIKVYKIMLRFRDDVTESMQVRFGAELLDITAVDDPDGRRRDLLIMAQTGTALPTA